MAVQLLRKIRSSSAMKALKARAQRFVKDEQLYSRLESSLEEIEALRSRLSELAASVEQQITTHSHRLAALEDSAGQLTDLQSRLSQLPGLQSHLSDVEVSVGQLLSMVRREAEIPPTPPKQLQIRVVGAYVPGFYESGFSICKDLEAVLGDAAKNLQDFERILDWGCGCGRVTRALSGRAPSCELHATDIDPEAIDWLKLNYARFADFRLAPHRPPTSYANDMFDFVLGLSVFTHLPEDMQFEWLEELKRITRPGAYLFLSTSGEKNYRLLDGPTQEILDTKGFFYSDAVNYGRSISLPDFYQNTFHAHHYIRKEWSKFFDVIDIQASRVQNHQDAVLLRKRS